MLARIRADIVAALAEEGLHIVRPVSQEALDAAGVSLSLRALLPGPTPVSGLVIGDGGGDFFRRFQAAGPGAGADPLDHHTRQVVPAALARALGPAHPFAVRFPFAAEEPLLPMQQLGRAAGLPDPGPLALQVHPRFGPWWAYRAFAVLGLAWPPEPPLAAICPTCPAPCLPACPARAVQLTGFSLGRCSDRRRADEGCATSCAARLACPVGASERYPAAQLAFHMTASLIQIRRSGGPARA
jgi:hypothetical protein